jgi:heme-degrading monooxygenase HmoA
MVFVSVTRVRVRSLRFLPPFFLHTFRSRQQVKKSSGFLTGALLADRNRTFWTMTVWDSQQSMRAFMTSGAHQRAMPHLLHWFDEASLAHWTQSDATLPSWTEAHRRMRESGRPSRILHPNSQHATSNYPAPRTTAVGPIQPD